jgi:hypothetical protein
MLLDDCLLRSVGAVGIEILRKDKRCCSRGGDEGEAICPVFGSGGSEEGNATEVLPLAAEQHHE